MSALITKSDQNIIAANNLIKASLFSPSIHCAYYGCVQLMLHLLRTHFGKTELQITHEGKTGSKNENGFHNWLQNLIYIEFIRLNGTDAAKFNSKIRTLSTARARADYSTSDVNDNDALKAYNISIEAKKLLQKNFQL